MALRNIVVEGDEILRKHCREVDKITDRTKVLLDDMLETMRMENGVGIAAPQVGVMRRIFITEAEPGRVIEFINPEIIELRGEQTGAEGCLSVPGLVGDVTRPEYVKIKAIDRNGDEFTLELEEFDAVVTCHEFDHLEGILYIDKAENIRSAAAEEEEE